ncbi:MAG: hypothetical protein AABX38_03190 [Candidatus Micrarchaeota archaeon]
MAGIKSFVLRSSSSFFYGLCFTILFFLLGNAVITAQKPLLQDIFYNQIPKTFLGSAAVTKLIDNQVSSSLNDAQLETLLSSLPLLCSTNNPPEDLVLLCQDYNSGKINSAQDIKLFFRRLTLNNSADMLKTQFRTIFNQFDSILQIDSRLQFVLFLTAIGCLLFGFILGFLISNNLNQTSYLGFNTLFWSSLSNLFFFSIIYLFGVNLLNLFSPFIINFLSSSLPSTSVPIIQEILPQVFFLFLPWLQTISLNLLYYFAPVTILGLAGKVYFGAKKDDPSKAEPKES